MSKKVGIDIFCKHFGIELENTMAFGDGGNDISMLKHVHIGVAMGNANPEVKEIADYTTDDVDNNGIWNALKHYGVI
ncbi:HAD hydrolase family protein [Sphingobacterium daejeonense]|uniref:HAD hydrolase family protein n=1 Tax=Sphingobacterium daejeonense TaxID=371142 RepID=UPI0010C26FED|nr:HAD hydrolase family protein [Sphingobacterium daejeonense]VTP96648.1 Putative bifunctional phosphatase/peptidyl-prolyl cis-trans isomerase [Sphingobacterium daejeonense]